MEVIYVEVRIYLKFLPSLLCKKGLITQMNLDKWQEVVGPMLSLTCSLGHVGDKRSLTWRPFTAPTFFFFLTESFWSAGPELSCAWRQPQKGDTFQSLTLRSFNRRMFSPTPCPLLPRHHNHKEWSQTKQS